MFHQHSLKELIFSGLLATTLRKSFYNYQINFHRNLHQLTRQVRLFIKKSRYKTIVVTWLFWHHQNSFRYKFYAVMAVTIITTSSTTSIKWKHIFLGEFYDLVWKINLILALVDLRFSAKIYFKIKNYLHRSENWTYSPCVQVSHSLLFY